MIYIEMKPRLLQEYESTFVRVVRPLVNRCLGINPERKWIRQFYAPLLYTLAKRRNFFRSALLLKVGDSSDFAESAAWLAACAEIAWTCAIIVDDILDRAEEREGQTPAYVRFGFAHSIASVAGALLAVFNLICFVVPGPFKVRIARCLLGWVLLFRCMQAQLRYFRLDSLSAYIRYAQDINASIHWTLLSPVLGIEDKQLYRLLETYANNSAIAGKMRNDLTDYYGGSSERDSRFEDFKRRKASFPVLILKESKLTSEDRQLLNGFLTFNSAIQPNDILNLFDSYRIPEKGFALFAHRLRLSNEALKEMQSLGTMEAVVEELKRWNEYMKNGLLLQLQPFLR